MKRNNLWRFLLVLFIVGWSLYEIYPPGRQDLIEHFQNRAVRTDATFTEIVKQARTLQTERPKRDFGNLLDAIGTNDITRYFPFFETTTQPNPTTFILNRLQREAAGKVRLGIDLQGGTSFLVQMDTNRLENLQSTSDAINEAVEVLRKRVDRFGVAEPIIRPEGNNAILIQLPGLSESDMATARETIQKAAFLEFRLVHEKSRELIEAIDRGEIVPPGYEVMTNIRILPNGSKQVDRYVVRKRAEMTGGVKSAMVSRGNLGEPRINFTLDDTGRETFARITQEHVGQQLAIILDGELQSAPNIREPILTGSGEISGDYSAREAFQLANVLENPLKAPLTLINSSEVDPTLGQDTIRSGIKACIYGIIAVSVFMLIYYLLAGAVANVALVLNVIILLGVMCSVGTTLTLPGIAGIVLTIGMAVDANVLIFERIREESAKGKSMRGALEAGYDRAFSTIFDSHVTTLISSIILIFMGTGSVKGFGVTLTIGVATSLFTALVVTRLVFDWLLARNLLKSLKMLHIIRQTKLDFMRFAVPAFIGSWLLILIGIGYGIHRGDKVFGVEFVGGETITLSVDESKKPPVDQVREIATKASGAEVLVAYQHDISTGTDTLRVTARQFGAEESVGQKIFDALRSQFPDAGFGERPLSVSVVGPTVGKEIQKSAILACLFAMFGILVYVAFRYEFSFALAAVIAIIHDVLMTLGWYFLTDREMNATTVAAVLTIIGFSINDTIVIFDRIREDLKLGIRGTFREIINYALNQTLSRTIITSGTVFLATLSLYIFGGGVINDFAFAFLVGILTGTYSSIYIAAFLVLRFNKGQRPKIGSTQLSTESAAPARG